MKLQNSFCKVNGIFFVMNCGVCTGRSRFCSQQPHFSNKESREFISHLKTHISWYLVFGRHQFSSYKCIYHIANKQIFHYVCIVFSFYLYRKGTFRSKQYSPDKMSHKYIAFCINVVITFQEANNMQNHLVRYLLCRIG